MELGLARAGRSDSRVVVGPWLSEISVEVLYWIPVLRRLFERHGIAPERVTAISRGGTQDWYAGVADRYVDVHDLMGLDEFRAAQKRRVAEAGDQRQLRVTGLDRKLWRRARVGGALVLHPLVMYSRLRDFWAGEEELDAAARRCAWRRFPAPPPPALELPDRFVAAKLYFSDCFPDTPANRAVVRDVLLTLAKHEDVVLLSTGLELDDHAEPGAPDHPRIHGIGPLEPRDNLAVQTRVLARARALVGTYGGPSYLAPCLGIPSVSLASLPNHNRQHLEAARAAAAAMDAPVPVLLNASAGYVAQRTLAALAASSSTSSAKPAGAGSSGAANHGS